MTVKRDKKLGMFKPLFMVLRAGVILMILLILLPFWLLFVKLVNIIGINGIRSEDGQLQTPVVFYENPATNRIVVFVATIHLAESEYYNAIQKLIDSLGYKVLFEGTGKLSPQEEQTLTSKERDVANQFNFIFELMRKLGEIMSLQYQKEGLSYPPSWINTDMKLSDIIRLFAERDIHLIKIMQNIDELFDSDEGRATTKWFLNKLFNRFVPVAVVLAVIAFFSRNKTMAKRLIIDGRNEVAFQGISEHLEDGHIITIWGAAHLGGIEKKIKKAGFKEIHRIWFTAYTVRSDTFLDLRKKI